MVALMAGCNKSLQSEVFSFDVSFSLSRFSNDVEFFPLFRSGDYSRRRGRLLGQPHGPLSGANAGGGWSARPGQSKNRSKYRRLKCRFAPVPLGHHAIDSRANMRLWRPVLLLLFCFCVSAPAFLRACSRALSGFMARLRAP